MSSRSTQVFSERRQNAESNSRVMSTTGRLPVEVDDNPWREAVIDDQTGTPPGSPDVGDRYIIPCGATGAWAGHTGEIAEWDGVAWVFTTPIPGSTAFVEAQNYLTTFVTTPQLAGPESDVDADFWFPHHFIDASHNIEPWTIVDRLSTPPVSPNQLDAYLVTATATGDWVGHEDQIAIRVCNALTDGPVWVFLDPDPGRLLYIVDENIYYIYNGGWAPFALAVSFDDLTDTDTAGVATGDLYQWDGTNLVPITLEDLADALSSLTFLGELADVDDSAATTGQFLVRLVDGTYAFQTITHPGFNLDDLLDVDTAGGGTGYILVQLGDGSFGLQAPAGAASYALDDLTDVDATGGSTGWVLVQDSGGGFHLVDPSTLSSPSTTNGSSGCVMYERTETGMTVGTQVVGSFPLVANGSYEFNVRVAIMIYNNNGGFESRLSSNGSFATSYIFVSVAQQDNADTWFSASPAVSAGSFPSGPEVDFVANYTTLAALIGGSGTTTVRVLFHVCWTRIEL